MSRVHETQDALDLMEDALQKMTQSVEELRAVVVALKDGDKRIVDVVDCELAAKKVKDDATVVRSNVRTDAALARDRIIGDANIARDEVKNAAGEARELLVKQNEQDTKDRNAY